MSYHRDSEFSSGPGAIAAIDGVTPRRKRVRGLRARMSAMRDRKMAGMTFGPMGGLRNPRLAMGLVSATGKAFQSPRQPTVTTGTVGPDGGGYQAPHPVMVPGGPTGPYFPPVPPRPPTRFHGGGTYGIGPTRVGGVIAPPQGPAGGTAVPWPGSGAGGSSGPSSGLYPPPVTGTNNGTVVVDPIQPPYVPPGTSSTSGASGSSTIAATGAGGGGGGDTSAGGGDSSSSDGTVPVPPDTTTSSGGTKTLAIVAGVALGAWFLFFRNRI